MTNSFLLFQGLELCVGDTFIICMFLFGSSVDIMSHYKQNGYPWNTSLRSYILQMEV